jgi:hypothetical protein
MDDLNNLLHDQNKNWPHKSLCKNPRNSQLKTLQGKSKKKKMGQLQLYT